MSRIVTEQPPHRSPPTDEAEEELGAKPLARPSNDAVAPDQQQGATIGKHKPTRRWGDARNIARDDEPQER